MAENNTLHIFTISFPLGKDESFLFNEVQYLASNFDTIYIYPMQCLDKEMHYSLPSNIEVVRFNIFQPYSRLTVTLKNIGLIAKLYALEIRNSKNGWKHLNCLKKTLNELTHKIAMAQKFDGYLISKNQNLNIAYTYWFNQWTFILSIIHKRKPNFKLFTRIHGADVYEEQHEQGFFFMFRGFQLKELQQIFSISNNGKFHIEKSNVFAKNKVKTVRLGTKDYGVNSEKTNNGF